MRKLLLLLLLALPAFVHSQIKGTVKDEGGKPIPYVTVFLDNSYKGTTANESGEYELNVHTPGKYTVVFQFLGFRTKKVTADIAKFPYVIEVVLSEENIALNEVVINSKDNPANDIIRSAIAARKENSVKTGKYKADFYSRGIFRIKDAPKKILGQKIDMFDDILDSTRSGILYLSETVSKIVYQKPDKLKETIIASKVSGDDSGFSFNNAASVDFDFYENYLPFSVNVISPIASTAFSYYRYKLEGTFFDENQHQINKIKVTPRRDTEPAVSGYIYIVDNSWAIYAVDVSIKGKQIQTPAINTLALKQNFNFNSKNNLWIRNSQVLDFDAGLLGVKFSGRFTYVYSNFEFEDRFPKNTFTKEILSFEKDANKKSDAYWEENRPVPLTSEESGDYIKKGALQEKKKSKKYLDSIDVQKNRFKIFDIITGYTYQHSYVNESYSYDGVLSKIGFNTVQGYNFSSGLSYSKRNPDDRTFTTVGVNGNYGISEDRFRATGNITRKFNNISNLQMTLQGGSEAVQFNRENPISRIVNSIATSFFRNNYMKLYDRTFISLNYRQEIVNGIHIDATVEYNRRKQLFNNTNESIIRNDKGYTSNNPLFPEDFTTPFFETHQLAKAYLGARFNFGQEYWMRPDGKFNIRNEAYPTLFVGYEKGFAASEKHYNFDHVSARVVYDLNLGNRGLIGMNIRSGKFFNGEGISFVDYRHFNGNRTHIGQSDRYLNTFNLLPYYEASTNDQYAEGHFEYDDKGFIINKIPLLNLLQSSLVIGFHDLAVPGMKPYMETSIGLDNLGFGKFKLFRLDYVRSYQYGFREDGIVIGMKFLNLLD